MRGLAKRIKIGLAGLVLFSVAGGALIVYRRSGPVASLRFVEYQADSAIVELTNHGGGQLFGGARIMFYTNGDWSPWPIWSLASVSREINLKGHEAVKMTFLTKTGSPARVKARFLQISSPIRRTVEDASLKAGIDIRRKTTELSAELPPR
jgi:hypothetical protein